ncbi:nitrite reductase (NAD(P)H) small subunit [Stigmatella sp. ncwal1]|uniref:Nitrite reductase (NAD(P)H) small subunit n=1 Tax=Stigmatella ashevillensis TaxID=2995309 RepID=A0ABT5D4A3_9BACT|nr:Rieske 2Fe-2S domain-containing protein [Stigmatella ashevillena]MDC0708491.1 nitrite reductase (NAD(P)H) small subunit [Stigmatella ashevillena]
MERHPPGLFIPVARLSDLDARGRTVVQVDGRAVAILRVAGALYAVEDACPHREGPLSEGDLDGFILHCPLHAWPFDVRSGICSSTPDVRVRTWPVRVLGEEIQLKVDRI